MIPVVLIGEVAELAGEMLDLGIDGGVLLLELLPLPGQVLHLITEGGVQQHHLVLLSDQVLHLLVIERGGAGGVDTLHELDLSLGNLGLLLSCF